MTGVAAQMCGNPEPEYKLQVETEDPNIDWGNRKAILNDLSPIATFLSYNYNSSVDVQKFRERLEKAINKCLVEYGWVYETKHIPENQESFINEQIGVINHVIWSDIFICPHCGNEIIFWNAAVDVNEGKVKINFFALGVGFH